MTDVMFSNSNGLKWRVEYDYDMERYAVTVTEIRVGLVGLPHTLNAVICGSLQDYFEEELIQHLTFTKKRPVFLENHIDEVVA